MDPALIRVPRSHFQYMIPFLYSKVSAISSEETIGIVVGI